MTIPKYPPSDSSLTDLKRLMVKAASRRVPDRHLGKGATVAQSYAQEKARLVFLHALWTRVPTSTADLLADAPLTTLVPTTISDVLEGAPPTTLVGFIEWQRTVPAANPLTPSDPGPARPDHPLLETQRQINLALREHISRWQARHYLLDAWFARAARFTLEMTNGGSDDPYNGPLLLDLADSFADIADGRAGPALVVLSEDDAVLGTFDPRTETVNSAAKRMLPEIERRLRSILQTIMNEDRELNDVGRPVKYHTSKSFERLVRFQVLRESKADIAKKDGLTERQVHRDLADKAQLLGLALRPQRRGRPPRKTAHTVKVKT